MNIGDHIPLLNINAENGNSIWSVGGGKGGTGKSFFSSNLAIQLAQEGKEVILIDGDLGGPNLHTFLGMKQSDVDLGHFFTNQVGSLEDTLIATPYERLNFIKGTENIPFTANINYYKKIKLLRHIKAFQQKHIIIDIGTGSSYNNVDLFLMSNPGILVINPEPTSIENAYYFLKSCIVRLIKLYIESYKIQGLMEMLNEQLQDNNKSIYSFLSEVLSQDRYYAGMLHRALMKFSPCLIINKARTQRDIYLGESIHYVVQKYLVIDLKYLGAIPFDDNVHKSLKNLSPFIVNHSDSPTAESIKLISHKLLNGLETDDTTQEKEKSHAVEKNRRYEFI